MLEILTAFIIIASVILIHEMGHFVAAKLAGLRILCFSVGFGPRLWQKRIGGTLFCLSAIPLGGYVRPYYAVEASEDKPRSRLLSAITPLGAEELEIASTLTVSDSGNLANASMGARVSFILGGIAFNLVFAFLAGFAIFYTQQAVVHLSPDLRIAHVRPSVLTAGLMRGDVITRIDSVPVGDWDTIGKLIRAAGEKPIQIEFVRDVGREKETHQVTITPKRSPSTSISAPQYSIGFSAARITRPCSIIDAARGALWLMYFETKTLFFSDDAQADNQKRASDAPDPSWSFVGGALTIGIVGSESIKEFVGVFVFLSLIAAIMNAVPYPALDGGQLVMLLLEKTGRFSITPRFRERLAYFGLASSLMASIAFLGKDVWTSILLMIR